ncbi:hypothetical protein AB7315_14920 [Providencia manganoxydans]
MNTSTDMTLAQQSAQIMYRDDACAKAMGMSIEQVSGHCCKV